MYLMSQVELVLWREQHNYTAFPSAKKSIDAQRFFFGVLLCFVCLRLTRSSRRFAGGEDDASEINTHFGGEIKPGNFPATRGEFTHAPCMFLCCVFTPPPFSHVAFACFLCVGSS